MECVYDIQLMILLFIRELLDLMDEMDSKRGDFHIFQNEYILALKITLTFYNRLLKPTVLSKSGLLLNMPSSTLN